MHVRLAVLHARSKLRACMRARVPCACVLKPGLLTASSRIAVWRHACPYCRDATNDKITVDAAKAILVGDRGGGGRLAGQSCPECPTAAAATVGTQFGPGQALHRAASAAGHVSSSRRLATAKLPGFGIWGQHPTPRTLQECGVGIKCATITPDEARVEEFGLKKVGVRGWGSKAAEQARHNMSGVGRLLWRPAVVQGAELALACGAPAAGCRPRRGASSHAPPPAPN